MGKGKCNCSPCKDQPQPGPGAVRDPYQIGEYRRNRQGSAAKGNRLRKIKNPGRCYQHPPGSGKNHQAGNAYPTCQSQGAYFYGNHKDCPHSGPAFCALLRQGQPDLIDKYIHFYNHERIQNKTGVAPLTLLTPHKLNISYIGAFFVLSAQTGAVQFEYLLFCFVIKLRKPSGHGRGGRVGASAVNSGSVSQVPWPRIPICRRDCNHYRDSSGSDLCSALWRFLRIFDY